MEKRAVRTIRTIVKYAGAVNQRRMETDFKSFFDSETWLLISEKDSSGEYFF